MNKTKKILFLFLIVGLSTQCFSQTRQAVICGWPIKKPSTDLKLLQGQAIIDYDTIMNFGVIDTLALYKNTGTSTWGYISGTNSYEDKAKAEKFLSTSYIHSYKLIGAIFYFAKAVDSDTATTMLVRAWNNNGTNSYPNTVLGTATLLTSEMKTNDTATIVMFDSPISVSSDFYLGLDSFFYKTIQEDTVALFSNTKNSHQVNSAYEKWSDDSWHAFTESGSWGFKISLKIAAILCDSNSVGIEIINPTNELVLFPNPSDGNFYLQSNEEHAGMVSIKVFDSVGKMVTSSENYSQKGGTFKIEMKDKTPGAYYLHLSTASKIIKKRFVIY